MEIDDVDKASGSVGVAGGLVRGGGEGSAIGDLVELLGIEVDVAPCTARRPWIFFINGVIFFLKFNSSGMKKEER